MADIRLQPPDSFNLCNPDDWPWWKQRFVQLRDASGLGEQAGSKQVNTLLYCLREEVESVLTSTGATAEDRASYDATIAKFNSFFKVWHNEIFERARFNRRNQQADETAEQYIMALYDLVTNCKYGRFKSEMIRIRLVVGSVISLSHSIFNSTQNSPSRRQRRRSTRA